MHLQRFWICFFYSTLELLGLMWWMQWHFWFFWKIILFPNSGYDMAHTCDLDTKNYSAPLSTMLGSKIYHIWPTLQHVWDMSTIFPTKSCKSTKKFIKLQNLSHCQFVPWSMYCNYNDFYCCLNWMSAVVLLQCL